MKSPSIKNLVDKLKNITGIKLEYYRDRFLEKRINFRINNLHMESYEEYLDYLLANPEEINYFLEKFTINYTHFFRNYEIFQKLEELLKLYVVGLKRPIRIWSAPCATGEEPYSIAMLVEKVKNEFKNFPNYEIIASDIDKSALIIARSGVYSDYSIHELPKYYYYAHFTKQNTPVGPKYSISEDIKSKVEFIEEDLINGHKKNTQYDVIFCRNFFIYIKKSSQETMLKMFENRLVEGGLLILGKSEMIMKTNSRFQSIDPSNHFYVKGKLRRIQLLKKQQISPIKKEIERKKVDHVEEKIISPIVVNQTKSIIKKPITPIKKRKTKSIKVKSTKPIAKKPVKPIEKKKIKPIEVKTTKSIKRKLITPIEKKVIKQVEKSIVKPIEMKTVLPEENHITKIEKPEIQIEQYEISIKNKSKQLELQGKRLEKLIEMVKKQESQLKQRKIHLNQLEIILSLREKKLESRESDLEQKILQNEQSEKEKEIRVKVFEYQLKQLEIKEKLLEQKKKSEKLLIDEDYDRISKPNYNGEMNIPIGHYAVLNSFDNKNRSFKFSVYDLGSGIALILRDTINKVYAISHISLPKSSGPKNEGSLMYPHKFINTSVKDLLNKILYHGANVKKVKAIVVGGAKSIYKEGLIHQENIDTIKQELFSNHIPIAKKFLGGISDRSIMYDTSNDSLYFKKKWEEDFRRVDI